LGEATVADVHPGAGPVGGIITAIRALGGSAAGVVIVSCDLAFLGSEHVLALVARFESGDLGWCDVVVARTEPGLQVQPLCAVWRPGALERIEAAFDAGKRSVFGVLDVLDVAEILLASDGLRNINTPSDLDAATSQQYPAPVAYGEITVGELQALGDAVRVIDVRELDEWEQGHIPWAVHVPLGTVPEHLERFDGVPTYVVCRSGGRSGRACEFAADHGVETVNVVGGMLAWADAGFATDGGDTDG
jgi:rhodanese-related sulfurtransferase/molybdopterin-guanine dinucleotide biosynthesis protein A